MHVLFVAKAFQTEALIGVQQLAAAATQFLAENGADQTTDNEDNNDNNDDDKNNNNSNNNSNTNTRDETNVAPATIATNSSTE